MMLSMDTQICANQSTTGEAQWKLIVYSMDRQADA